MNCLRPYQLNHHLYDYYTFVPCGKCVMCKRERQKDWVTRLMNELTTNKGYSWFITLTYNDEHLPDRGELCHRDVQLYLKRVRKLSGDKIKYFLCGEYCPTSYRPHYHLILFHQRIDTYDILRKEWIDKGFVNFGTVGIKSCRYVLKYIDKQMELKWFYEMNNLTPPYQRMSKGIGEEYLKKYEDSMYKGYIIVDGKKRRIPRYYIKKSKTLSVLRELSISERLTTKEGLSDRLIYNSIINDREELVKVHSEIKQLEKNLRTQSQNKKRGLKDLVSSSVSATAKSL